MDTINQKVIDALNTMSSGNADQLSDEQLCALAVHYAVILRNSAPSDMQIFKDVIAAWDKIPRDVWAKFTQYVFATKNAETPDSPAAWEQQIAAIRKYGLIDR